MSMSKINLFYLLLMLMRKLCPCPCPSPRHLRELCPCVHVHVQDNRLLPGESNSNSETRNVRASNANDLIRLGHHQEVNHHPGGVTDGMQLVGLVVVVPSENGM